jgi:beta-lactamase regulating signal transducer with metallopeptidase domain
MWENKSKLIFTSCLIISGLLFFQMAMYVLQVLLGWQTNYNLIQLCHTAIGFLGLFWIGYILNAVVFYTFLYSLWIAAKQIYISISFNRKLARSRNGLLSRSINERFGSGKEQIWIVQNERPAAMAIGIWNPRIILSTGLLHVLSEDELEAVIHHEMYHMKHADPLKTFILSYFATVMWYVPVLNLLRHNYKIVREVLADTYAIHQMGNSFMLGSALLKLLKGRIPERVPISCVSFADTSVNYRIRKILDPHVEPDLQWPIKPTLVSIHVLLIMCTLFILALH